MESPVSNWFNAGTLPDSYVFPQQNRPGKLDFCIGKMIPVIDLQNHNRNTTIQKILDASQEYGIFQVINHGVPKELMDDTMKVMKKFHAMPLNDKARECSKDPKKSCKLYTSSEHYSAEQIHCWRDVLVHQCHPLEDYMQFWPDKPSTYKEVVGRFTVEARKMATRILELIDQGLGFSPGYLSDSEYSQKPILMVNHYPPCPDPCLTLGLPKHSDPSVITIVLQGNVPGLQVFKDGEWLVVEPLAHAFVVNIGYVLQIISNGKLKGVEHRVVTNSNIARTTISMFIYPSDDSLIQPATALINARNPPLYRAFIYKEFRSKYLSAAADSKAVDEFIRQTTI
ncbi:hypothetical protein FEM48_Zijuj09G0055800 [Ziziphus jujuba var. spinosa]|uniref:Fe2OG dioxygenase domain-containing protein n=1 Tax=Ziziphus jujuba var. spinosa TaxID=714518 RepID=A0A978UR64_ZIZJJ|nr:hypothetical protein FEM48_Zijuj09G0055800 [Ziziphus jujuba var. spinosa]